MATRRSDVLRAPPRVARPLTGRGRLPELANLVNRSPEELVRTLGRFGIVPDVEAIEKAAGRAFEPIDALVRRGLVPDEEAWANIEKDFNRRVKSSLVDMTRSAIRLYRLDRIEKEGGRAVWISALRNPCPSCERRHGKVKTLKEWARQGLPGDPVLLCCSFKPNCQCTLLPA